MNIQERLKQMVDTVKSEKAKSGGPNPNYQIGAEAEIVVRGPNGEIKNKVKANNTEITL